MPVLSGPILRCYAAHKNKQKPPNQPGHWRNGPSAHPTDDSQQETGEAGRAKARSCRGRGGCGSVDQVDLGAREETQDARDSRNPPPDHPETRRKGGGEKRGKGNPTNPETKKESATRPRKTEKESTKCRCPAHPRGAPKNPKRKRRNTRQKQDKGLSFKGR